MTVPGNSGLIQGDERQGIAPDGRCIHYVPRSTIDIKL